MHLYKTNQFIAGRFGRGIYKCSLVQSPHWDCLEVQCILNQQISLLNQAIREFDKGAILSSAQGGTRTPMLLRALPPEDSASANFATWARLSTFYQISLTLDNQNEISHHLPDEQNLLG